MAVTLWACLVGGAGHDSSSGEAGRCSSVFPRGGESMFPVNRWLPPSAPYQAALAGPSPTNTGPAPRPQMPFGPMGGFSGGAPGGGQQLPPWLLQAYTSAFGGMAPGMQPGTPQAPQGGFQGMPGGGMPGGFGGWQGHPMPFQPGSQFGAPQQPGIFGQGFGAQQGGFGGGYGSMNPQMMHPMPVMPQRGSAASFY